MEMIPVVQGGAAAVAKKRSESRRYNTLVRLDDELAEKTKKVAALRGQSVAEYISDALWPIVNRDLVKEIKKLAGEQEESRD